MADEDVNTLYPMLYELRTALLPSELNHLRKYRYYPIWDWLVKASPAERHAAVERIPSAKQLRARKKWDGMYVVEMPDGVEVHIQKNDQIYDPEEYGGYPDGWDMSVIMPGPGNQPFNDWIASKTAALFLARQVWLLEGGYVARDQRERERRFERFGY